MNNWMKITFAFVIGVFLGVAGTGLYIHHCFHEARARQGNFKPFLDKLTARLGLSSAQRESIGAVFSDFGTKLEASRVDTNLKLKALRDASNEKIRAILNDDQKQKFNDMISKWEATHNDPKGWNVPGAMPPPSLGALVPRSNSPPTPSDGKP
jgi:hypothetical protein